jgi:hypothetical protein
VWQVFDTTVSATPFVSGAKYVSVILIGAGGGGGGGRFGVSTAASGGGGGSGAPRIIRPRIPISIFTNLGVYAFGVTIGAGGTGGAGATTDGSNGTAGTNGGATSLNISTSKFSSQFSWQPGPGVAGSGGTTTTGSGGAPFTTLPWNGFQGAAGGTGRTTFGDSAYSQQPWPYNSGPLGGNGGFGKGNAGTVIFGVTPVLGYLGGAVGSSSFGTSGIDAVVVSQRLMDELFQLKKFPDIFELQNYMPAGGGTGCGGDTTANTAGGNGGAGWRGSGGGGGGGASGVAGGNGGAGGNGCVILCWEFE